MTPEGCRPWGGALLSCRPDGAGRKYQPGWNNWRSDLALREALRNRVEFPQPGTRSSSSRRLREGGSRLEKIAHNCLLTLLADYTNCMIRWFLQRMNRQDSRRTGGSWLALLGLRPLARSGCRASDRFATSWASASSPSGARSSSWCSKGLLNRFRGRGTAFAAL